MTKSQKHLLHYECRHFKDSSESHIDKKKVFLNICKFHTAIDKALRRNVGCKMLRLLSEKADVESF